MHLGNFNQHHSGIPKVAAGNRPLPVVSAGVILSLLCTICGASQLTFAQSAPPKSKISKVILPPPQYTKDPPPGFSAPFYSTNLVEVRYAAIKGKSGSTTYSAVSKTTDSVQTVFSWYEQALVAAGWQIDQHVSEVQPPKTGLRERKMLMTGAARGDSKLLLTCMRPHGEKFTIVNLNICHAEPAGKNEPNK